MKKPALVLSELANRYGVKHSSADDAETIGTRIADHVDGLKPLALSERESKLVTANRTGQIDMMFSEGFINKAQADVLKASFASEDLVLSEGNSDPFELSEQAFNAVCKVLRGSNPRKPDEERTQAQTLELAEGDAGKGESKLVAEMKSRISA